MTDDKCQGSGGWPNQGAHPVLAPAAAVSTFPAMTATDPKRTFAESNETSSLMNNGCETGRLRDAGKHESDDEESRGNHYRLVHVRSL